MGHQLLAYLTSNYNDEVLSPVTGDEGIVLPLTFLNTGYLFATLTSNQLTKVTQGNGLLYFNHQWAVSLDTFNSNINLKNFWNLISTSTSPRNQRFASSIQAKTYPFYGVQFHPEKNPF
jgi:gamma-glutamyl hydrolase